MDPLTLGLTLVAAVGVGATLGLLGGGGSILMVPLLVHVSGRDPKEAIVVSLVVVGATALGAAVPHARAGRVQWRTAATFGSAGMAGAFAGGRAGQTLPATFLLVAFALLMIGAAVGMLRERPTEPVQSVRPHPMRILALGLVVGAVTGMVGAGGGFLIVPALVLFGGVAVAQAIGTSLVVIAMQSAAGMFGHLGGTTPDWRFAAPVVVATLFGALFGAQFVDAIEPDRLRRAFGRFVLVLAALMLALEVPDDALAALAARAGDLGSWLVLATGVALGVAGTVLAARRNASDAGIDSGEAEGPARERPELPRAHADRRAPMAPRTRPGVHSAATR